MFKEYLRRVLICVSGLALFSLGNFFGIIAGDAGTNAWNTLALGISGSSGITFGTANLYISFAIIAIDLLGRGKLGFGTILNMLLIPVFSDFFIAVFSFVPTAQSMIAGSLLTLLGQLIISFGCILYMSPALGAGPRDTLMIIIGRKVPRFPIGVVKFAIEVVVLLVGFFMGAPLGLGTVLVMALQASLFQLACKICRYEPRDVKHEDVFDTLKRIRTA